ncbi:MAG: hypothetical protein ACI4WG_01755 [Erysipelotrichaceae bacterium]
MKNFLYKIQNKMRNFMVGRYGVDQLYVFNTYFLLVLIVLELFFKNRIYNYLVLAFMIFNIYRPFSKNHNARYKENQIFLKLKGKVTSFFKLQKKKFTERKLYSYKKCPNCKKTLRLKKVKGKHTVVCPNCKNEFDVRI